jgi:hypothetical protein
LFENLSVNVFKGDLSNATTFNPSLSQWSMPLTVVLNKLFPPNMLGWSYVLLKLKEALCAE